MLYWVQLRILVVYFMRLDRSGTKKSRWPDFSFIMRNMSVGIGGEGRIMQYI